jgi:hypothetical protein
MENNIENDCSLSLSASINFLDGYFCRVMDVIDQTKGTKNKLNSITYSTRMIKMDRVGVESTTSATRFVCCS